jgi:hypothetical protein
MRAAGITGAALLLAAAPAAAQSLDLNTVVEGHLGYTVNPKLVPGADSGSPYAGIRISPVLTQSTGTTQTTIGANYRREQYFSTYGHTESISGSFDHSRSLSEHLKATVSAHYVRSNNVLLNGDDDPIQIEDFSVGRTSSSISGGASLAWQATARDSFTVDGMYIHQNSRSAGVSRDFDEYLANVGYLHALNSRTSIGVRNNVTFFQAPGQPASRSIGPALAITQAFSSIWKLDADVGIIFQHIDAPINSDTKGLGFHASLCGTYPRSTFCLGAARRTSGSAFGGLRRQTSVTINYSYKMSERSTVSLDASYANNKSTRASATPIDVFSDTDILRGHVDYNRRLSERWSVGVEGRGGYRKGALVGKAHSVAGSAYLRVKIG